MNRGGRGWEPPAVFIKEFTLPPGVLEQSGVLEQVRELRQRQAAAGIIDLVQHNGVWMSPEDAARG